MKILYFSHFYYPEQIAAAFRASDHARIWAQKGHDITVFTGYPNYPTGKIFDGYIPRMLTEETVGKIRVLRSKIIAKPNTTMIRRIENALSFFLFGFCNLVFNGKKVRKDYDVILGTSGPIFAGLLGWLYASFIRKPFVFEVRDIVYRALIATGKPSDSLGVKLMRYLELFLAKHAAHVVVVTNGFKDMLIGDGIPAEKISVITNGTDAEMKEKQPPQNELVLSYFGTLGISQSIMDTFPYAEELSRLCGCFRYLIIGEGAQREQIEQIVRNEKIGFIEMMRGMTSQELEPYYDQSLLSVVALRKSDNFRSTIPSKLFQTMGRGVAVLFIGPEGEASEIIRKNESGIVLTATLEENLQTLRTFFSKDNWREELMRMGRNGAEAVRRSYTRTALAERYEEVLTQVIQQG